MDKPKVYEGHEPYVFISYAHANAPAHKMMICYQIMNKLYHPPCLFHTCILLYYI